ncbi:unnamed protein product [Tilletia caries]|uniref:Cytochrome c oxidase assembly factor 3 n=1 Tax=Tilletia caries TaxID=13290 RepID=A0A177V3K9_9BASI|nr:hypothetical protein CF336_g5644 [Tilletia laevis]KAE8256845.1 hypothetical protein A4X03_0g4996 [Tilletia caries]KAE8195982.1 hypothetical protein CF335_g4966 [Tilletia laevis]CAD6893287.1 unnamed protein product [Tilletia caries]CAD6941048.1 unnamed protein product [Tilletia caries]
MKICNSAALVLLALVSVCSVQGSPVPESPPHSLRIEQRAYYVTPEMLRLDRPSTSAVTRVASKVASIAPGKILGVVMVAGGAGVVYIYFVEPIIQAARHQHSGTSPTNGRRSVAPTTPTADTHRDLVRRQAAERISAEALPGEPGKLLYPIQARDGKHFDNEDAK